jgi:XTP/dITP diphosphohydrolase
VTRLLVATRNPGKVREIAAILAGFPGLQAVGLGIAEDPAEDALEVHPGFAENALAKASWFAALTGELTLADDSGICVDALGGAPGVRSRRFAGEQARGESQDQANNRHLLSLLDGLPAERRTAHYLCAAALAGPGREPLVRSGRCDGVVLEAPRGTGGFGYDPYFWLPAEGMSFGELPAERKNQISHRAQAVRAVLQAASEAGGGPV